MEILVSKGMSAALIRSTKTSIQRKKQWAETYKTTEKECTAKQKQFILIFQAVSLLQQIYVRTVMPSLHYYSFTA